MPLVAEQDAFLQDVCLLVVFAHSMLHYQVTGGELYRTLEQEQRYIEQGLSKLKDPANNYHTKRLAIDLNFFLGGVPLQHEEEYVPLGKYWKSLHPKNVWGGDWTFKDLGHFERHV